ncbi:UNVERIFIED_CONTAM: hypothetical protein GTU68_011051 [Idotea baltica]|nr:hypothetical protein [Idotea baltica]
MAGSVDRHQSLRLSLAGRPSCVGVDAAACKGSRGTPRHSGASGLPRPGSSRSCHGAGHAGPAVPAAACSSRGAGRHRHANLLQPQEGLGARRQGAGGSLQRLRPARGRPDRGSGQPQQSGWPADRCQKSSGDRPGPERTRRVPGPGRGLRRCHAGGEPLLPVTFLGHGNDVLVMRSFGKFFGLAGLRLGFLAGPQEVTARLSGLLESWSLSGPALEIGVAALRDTSWQDRMNRQLVDEMADLTLTLSRHGLSVFGGTPLYALAGLRNARDMHEALARRRIWTRIFDYAPTWIRFGLPGGPANLARLSDALADAQKEL